MQVKRWRARSLGLFGAGWWPPFSSSGWPVPRRTLGGPGPGWNPFTHDSEFGVIFANAVEIDRLKAIGATRELPAGFAFADFLALVPQQLLPFAKTNAGIWFLTEFHPWMLDQGGGLAFGAIAESVLGSGVLSALWRGAAIGLIFALLHRRVALGKPTMWALCFYVWLTVSSYQCFRATTFALIVPFVYQFVVAWVLVTILSVMFRRAPASSAGLAAGEGAQS